MSSEYLLPSSTLKLESFSFCECDNVQNSIREIISEVQVCENINNKTSANVKIEQPEVNVNYPGEEIMSSDCLSSSNTIKLEPFCEYANVQSSTREISEVKVFDKVCSKSSVKIEQPEVYVDYADEDMKIHACSQSCLSLQEQSQMEKKMVFANNNNIDWKHEPSDLLCQKTSKMLGMASYYSIPEITENNTETRMSEDTNLIHHREVSFIENSYTASQEHENCLYLSEAVTPMAEIDTKICLTNENFQIRKVETPVKQTQISIKSIDDAPDYTPSGSPQRIQAEDTACMFDNCDVTINVDTFSHGQKARDPGKKSYMCNVCSASFTKVDHLKRHERSHTGEKPYMCNVCSASFTSAGNLKYHNRTHTGEKPYKCDVCTASFTQAGNLKCHKRIHTGEKPYKCDVCAASFTKCAGLLCHKRTHTGEKPYMCDVCTASFTQSGSLKFHKRIHTGEKPYKCDVCAASYTTAGNLRCHKRIHTGEKPYKCNVCAASFTFADSLKCHMRTHTGEKPYMCDICPATFTKVFSLKSHKRTHTGEKEVLFNLTDNGYMAQQQHEHYSYLSEAVTSMAEIDTKICLTDENSQLDKVETPIKQTQISITSIDDTPYYTSGSPQRTQVEDTAYMFDNFDVTINVDTFSHGHKKRDPGKKSYMCDVCSASFTKVDHLKRHERSHTGEKPYMCNVCSASFTNAGNLKYHKRTHTGEKPYKCDVCTASFTQAGNLKCHKRTHTGEKPYKCDVCAASFTQLGGLLCHKRTHTGEKPYMCDVCTASFTQSGSLKFHKRTHTGEKPYKCDVCPASCTTAGNLRCHKRVHTGEKPYKCDMCAASFTFADSLMHHKSTHTGEKPYMCDVCAASYTQIGSLKCHMRTHTGKKNLHV